MEMDRPLDSADPPAKFGHYARQFPCQPATRCSPSPKVRVIRALIMRSARLRNAGLACSPAMNTTSVFNAYGRYLASLPMNACRHFRVAVSGLAMPPRIGPASCSEPGNTVTSYMWRGMRLLRPTRRGFSLIFTNTAAGQCAGVPLLWNFITTAPTSHSERHTTVDGSHKLTAANSRTISDA